MKIKLRSPFMKASLIKKINLFVILMLTGTVITLFYVVFRMDAAAWPINSDLIPETAGKTYQHREPVVLVSYADGPRVFFKNQNSLAQSALNKGFDAILTYRKGHLEPAFYDKNKAILEQPRGAGYWVWKPYLILKTMQMYPDNAVIIYADSGVVFSQPLLPLLQMLKTTPFIFVGNGKPVALRTHLKKEAREILLMAENDPRLDAQKIWAFFMIIKNTPQARAFVEDWLKLCQIKGAITDEPFDIKKQEKGFNAHLHDEALLSVIAATHPEGIKIIPKNILRNDYGITNFHRHPEEEYASPLVISAGLPQWLSTLLFNNLLAQQFRKHFFA